MVVTSAHARTPHVVIVDPCFDAYPELAASGRSGRINLHFRALGEEALHLAKRQSVDAWLVAADLEDMSGVDFVELLRAQLERDGATDTAGLPQRVAIVSEVPGKPGHWEALEHGADQTMVKPISLSDLESFLGMTPAEREMMLPGRDLARSILTLPVRMGAAAMAIAVVMMLS